jgi:hypothetical protein
MGEKTISRIPAMPFALMMGAVSGILGLIMGVFMSAFWASILSLIESNPSYTRPSLPGFSVFFGIWAIIFFPVAMFAMGLVQGLIMAVVYNFLAPRIGGIRLQFKGESQAPAPQ